MYRGRKRPWVDAANAQCLFEIVYYGKFIGYILYTYRNNNNNNNGTQGWLAATSIGDRMTVSVAIACHNFVCMRITKTTKATTTKFNSEKLKSKSKTFRLHEVRREQDRIDIQISRLMLCPNYVYF